MISSSINTKRIWALRREIRKKISEIGVIATFILIVRKVVDYLFKHNTLYIHPFDLQYGTDTSGIVERGALDIPDDEVKHATRYQTAIVDVFLEILNSLLISHEEYLFIDMGSGKGRALLLASQFPFKGIIGVELSENLHRIACRNINIYTDIMQACHNIQSMCENAAIFQIPNENIVFYLFNPFDKHIIRALLLNIEDSIHKHPRDIYIAYLKPIHRVVFDQAPFLQITKETERYVIYKNIN